MPSWPKPTSEQIDKMISSIAHPAQRRYFFDNLCNPEWIEPLCERGFFQVAPKAVINKSKNIVQNPAFPESKYLKRMVHFCPEQVSEIYLAMKIHENTLVYIDILEIASSVPLEYTIKLIDTHVLSWLKSIDQIPIPCAEYLQKLVKYLLIQQNEKYALLLVKKIFSFQTILQPERLENYFYTDKREIQTKLEHYEYESYLKQIGNIFIEQNNTTFLNYLINLLRGVLNSYSGNKNSHDWSNILRPAIEEHDQNLHTDIADFIISAIRDIAEKFISIDKNYFPKITTQLFGIKRPIFYRIALYLTRKFQNMFPDQVKTILLNRSFLNSVELRHEYGLLLKEGFFLLDEADQNTILAWIEEGPISESLTEEDQNTTDKEENIRYKKNWQLQYLSFIHQHLTPAWQAKYQKLVNEMGRPEHPEFLIYIKKIPGYTSPKSTEELARMEQDDLLDYLLNWKSQNNYEESTEGLARSLQGLVSENPETYLWILDHFATIKPVFLRATVSGIYDAQKQHKKFNQSDLLTLYSKIVTWLSLDSQSQGNNSDWRQVKMRILESVDTLLQKDDNSDFEHDKLIKQIILLLTDDIDPEPENEIYNSSSMDPSNRAINVVRGQALHSLIKYVLWKRRYFEQQNMQKELDSGLKIMPDVQTVLENHLDVKKDPSFAIRSVYGQLFPWLVKVDKNWSKTNVDRIFPDAAEFGDYFYTAWSAYISFNLAYKSSFVLLEKKYLAAINLIGTKSDLKVRISNPDEKLAEHLMQLYWQGNLDNDLKNLLLNEFWEKANAELTAYSIQHVGISLHRTKTKVDQVILDRLLELWNERIEINTQKHEPNFKELSNFGHWFSSGKFDAEKSLEMY
ncbi:hypothetical protein GF406_16890, partial [candidate division KSB1 bacterium]|nr:hypothetical protein [candidate division KSB1 bacterium]